MGGSIKDPEKFVFQADSPEMFGSHGGKLKVLELNVN